MTVEHRAAPGLNDIEIELADDGEGLALRPRRTMPREAAPERERSRTPDRAGARDGRIPTLAVRDPKTRRSAQRNRHRGTARACARGTCRARTGRALPLPPRRGKPSRQPQPGGAAHRLELPRHGTDRQRTQDCPDPIRPAVGRVHIPELAGRISPTVRAWIEHRSHVPAVLRTARSAGYVRFSSVAALGPSPDADAIQAVYQAVLIFPHRNRSEPAVRAGARDRAARRARPSSRHAAPAAADTGFRPWRTVSAGAANAPLRGDTDNETHHRTSGGPGRLNRSLPRVAGDDMAAGLSTV